MKNFLKRAVAATLAVSLFLVPTLQANAMTRKQVNSQITRLQKQIKKDKASYNAALKKDQDLETSYLKVDGTLYSPVEPYIVQMRDFGTQTSSYYHFKNLDHLTVTQNVDGGTKLVTGYAKLSDKTFDFYGTKAKEAEGREKPHAAVDTQTRISKNQARVKLLKNSKKDSISLNSTYTLTIGQSMTLDPIFKYNTADINKITWKSSNPKVVKVSKSGYVLGIAPGRATISAKLSVTGKSYKTTVNVIAGE